MYRRYLVLAVALLAVAFAAPLAQAKNGTPINGAGFTTVDEVADGTGHCQNGNPGVNCNLYAGKQYVWLNGGPAANGLGPNGVYFFAVLDPGGQPNPNDGNAANLSAYFDCYQNREFQITNGEVSAYYHSSDPNCFAAAAHTLSNGTVFGHDFDSGSNATPHAHPDGQPPFIRLYPYKDTDNNGGVYIMALCYLGTSQAQVTYPVDPKSCKYDAFKAPGPDATKPACTLTAVISGPPKQIQVTVQDGASGLESVSATATNADVSIPDFYAGWLSPLVITATKQTQSQGARVVITLTDVAGNTITCDPVLSNPTVLRLAGKHAAKTVLLSRSQGSVTVRNFSHAARSFVIALNGARYELRNLRAGETRRLNITASLVQQLRNRVAVKALGGTGRAVVTFSP